MLLDPMNFLLLLLGDCFGCRVDLLQLLDLLPNVLEILVEVGHGCQLQDTHACHTLHEMRLQYSNTVI